VSTQYLWIPGPLPGANEALAACRQARGKGSAYSKMKENLTTLVAYWAKVNELQPVDRADIDFVWVERNRKRDPDNVRFAAKFVLDGLVKAGVLKGDGWAHIGSLSDEFTVGTHGVHVAITPAMDKEE
jgi:hypothetical protein